MIPVPQTAFGEGKGDCFSACIASVLEMPLDRVPNFCLDRNPAWLDMARDFVRRESPYSILFITSNGEPDMIRQLRELAEQLDAFSVVGGVSPRCEPGTRWLHSVVLRGTTIIHDPHPSGAGLVGDPTDWIFFVARDPAKASETVAP